MRNVGFFLVGLLASGQLWAMEGVCEDANTNQSFVLGNIRVKEPIHFVYSTYNELQLAYDVMGERGNPRVITESGV
jgi:hypothetical protein